MQAIDNPASTHSSNDSLYSTPSSLSTPSAFHLGYSPTHFLTYLAGSPSVGKTHLIMKLLQLDMPSSHQPTLSKIYNTSFVYGSFKYMLRLWDLGGSTKTSPIRQAVYSVPFSSKVALIVYDVTSLHSFQQVPSFIQEWKRSVEPQNQNSIILVANKTDQHSHRCVDITMGLQLAKQYGIVYLQCSAINDVRHIFETAILLSLCQSGHQQIAQQYLTQNSQQIKQLQCQLTRAKKQHNQEYLQVYKLQAQWNMKIRQIVQKLMSLLPIQDKLSIDQKSPTFQALLQHVSNSYELKQQQKQLSHIKQIKQILNNKIKDHKNGKQTVLFDDEDILLCASRKNAQRLMKVERIESATNDKISTLRKLHVDNGKFIECKLRTLKKSLHLLQKDMLECAQDTQLQQLIQKVKQSPIYRQSIGNQLCQSKSMSRTRIHSQPGILQLVNRIQQEYKALDKLVVQTIFINSKKLKMIQMLLKQLQHNVNVVQQHKNQHILMHLVDFYVGACYEDNYSRKQKAECQNKSKMQSIKVNKLDGLRNVINRLKNEYDNHRANQVRIMREQIGSNHNHNNSQQVQLVDIQWQIKYNNQLVLYKLVNDQVN